MNQQTSSGTNMKRTIFILAAIVITGIIVGVIATQFKASKTPDFLKGYGGNFTLQSAQGPVSLSDFKGKAVAIYFGYTSCPDACPMTMGLLSTALNKLEKDELAKVQVLLVSFDPERDTPEVLASYVKQFHPNILGITGSKQDVARISNLYGTIFERVELSNSAMGYAFDHSSITAVVDVNGDMRSLIRHQDTVEDILAKLREAMAG